MFVNDINSELVIRQNHAELQQRAAEERLARQILRARRTDRSGVFVRLGRIFGQPARVNGRHRTAH